MTLLASNFTANSLGGTVVVSGGLANVFYGGINYTALEGTKTYYVKLRRTSNTGPIIGVSSPILIPDRTSIVSVMANVSTVSELAPNIINWTIVTANVNGTVVLPWETLANTGTVDSSDFIANTGTVSITNNVGTFSTQISADQSLVPETNESFRVRLKGATSGAQVGNVIYATTVANAVVIFDTSRTPTIVSAVPNVTIVSDYAIVSYTIITTNANAIPIYYSTEGSLPVATELLGANTGSFTPTNDSNTYALSLRFGNVIAEPRNLKLQFRTDGPTGNIRYVTANVFVFSAPIQLSASGTYTSLTSGDYTSIAYTGPGGATITYAPQGGKTLSYLVVGGGGGGGAVNYGYMSEQAGGGGGVLLGNLNVFAGNTFSTTIGAGGAAGQHGSAYTMPSAGAGSTSTLSSPSFTSVAALGGGTSSSGSSNYATGGGQGPGQTAFGSPGTYGVAGPQGYPGGQTAPSSYGGGGGGGAGGSGGTFPNPVTPFGADGRGGVGVGFETSPSLGTPGPNPLQRYFGGGGGIGTNAYNNPGASLDSVNPSSHPSVLGGAGGGGPSQAFYTVADNTASARGQNGNVNTGGGGGGWTVAYPGGVNGGNPGGSGGAGIIILRYKISNNAFRYNA
jgi:hypothetical protein